MTTYTRVQRRSPREMRVYEKYDEPRPRYISMINLPSVLGVSRNLIKILASPVLILSHQLRRSGPDLKLQAILVAKVVGARGLFRRLSGTDGNAFCRKSLGLLLVSQWPSLERG